jgi:hypothetical protein
LDILFENIPSGNPVSEHYQIRRTCTDDFEVNFFMVNHACMTEGHRHGHMCFCEEDECNAASTVAATAANILLPFFVVWSVKVSKP